VTLSVFPLPFSQHVFTNQCQFPLCHFANDNLSCELERISAETRTQLSLIMEKSAVSPHHSYASSL